jgi:hypothetical protein
MQHLDFLVEAILEALLPRIHLGQVFVVQAL